MDYFKFSEFVKSDTAKKKGIENIPTWEQLENIKRTAEFLDKIRFECGFPIVINSGFRSAELNKAVGGVSTSAHLLGNASDIVPSKSTPAKMAILKSVLKSHLNECDQIIEYGTFFHVGLSNTPRKQWIKK